MAPQTGTDIPTREALDVLGPDLVQVLMDYFEAMHETVAWTEQVEQAQGESPGVVEVAGPA